MDPAWCSGPPCSAAKAVCRSASENATGLCEQRSLELCTVTALLVDMWAQRAEKVQCGELVFLSWTVLEPP